MALFVLVKAYYVFNYVFSFDCSCLFADILCLFSQFSCVIIGYLLLGIDMWYELVFGPLILFLVNLFF